MRKTMTQWGITTPEIISSTQLKNINSGLGISENLSNWSPSSGAFSGSSSPVSDLGKFSKTSTSTNASTASIGTSGGSKGLNIASGIAGGVSSALKSISSNSSNAQADPESYAVGQGIGDAVSQIHPIAAIAVAAGRTADLFMGDSGWSSVNKDSAKRAGYNAGVNNLLASIPGNSVWGAFMKKSKTADKSVVFDSGEASSSYGGTSADYSAAQDLSGKKTLGGRRKINNFITDVNKKVEIATNNIQTAKLLKTNTASDTLLSQNQNKYSGYTPTALLSRKGMKFPELESAHQLLNSWNNKQKSSNTESSTQKFQLGGKMNLIPEGALHARKHDIVSSDPELEGQITTKGIPVISKSGGEITQHAEIEREEWTLRKEFTDQLESLYKKYQEDPSNELAIEAGKLVCYELLKNTDDRSGLIKSIK